MTIADIIKNFFANMFAFDEAHPLLFTQFYFWAFFAIVFVVFSLIKNKILLRNTFLFFVSLFFYYKTSGLFTLILIFVTIYNFIAGIWLSSRKEDWSKKTIIIIIATIAIKIFLVLFFIS